MFEEITASSLVKVDLDGALIGASEYGINYAGYVIHSALHAARDDALFHRAFPFAGRHGGISAQEGLLPLNQRALATIPRLQLSRLLRVLRSISTNGKRTGRRPR